MADERIALVAHLMRRAGVGATRDELEVPADRPYAEYPSVKPKDWLTDEDLAHTIGFRGIYGTMLEQWMGVEAAPIVGGTFEQIQPFSTTPAA